MDFIWKAITGVVMTAAVIYSLATMFVWGYAIIHNLFTMFSR